MFAPADLILTTAGVHPMLSRCFLPRCPNPICCPAAHSRAGLLKPRVSESDLTSSFILRFVGKRCLHVCAAAPGVGNVSKSTAAATSVSRLPPQTSQERRNDGFYAPSNATFASLGVDSSVIAALAAAGYSRPSNVQVAKSVEREIHTAVCLTTFCCAQTSSDAFN